MCPPPTLSLLADFVVDQTQAVKFALDIARGMAFLHTLEPLIPRHYLNSRSIMVRIGQGTYGWRAGEFLGLEQMNHHLLQQIDEDMTARISMADVKFSFQCPGRMYAPAWVAPEGEHIRLLLLLAGLGCSTHLGNSPPSLGAGRAIAFPGKRDPSGCTARPSLGGLRCLSPALLSISLQLFRRRRRRLTGARLICGVLRCCCGNW